MQQGGAFLTGKVWLELSLPLIMIYEINSQALIQKTQEI